MSNPEIALIALDRKIQELEDKVDGLRKEILGHADEFLSTSVLAKAYESAGIKSGALGQATWAEDTIRGKAAQIRELKSKISALEEFKVSLASDAHTRAEIAAIESKYRELRVAD